jgi:hypothetical protein
MAETTTIRVQRSTRELLRAAAGAEHVTFDTLIRTALEAHEWNRLRKQAAAESLALRDDPHEQAVAQEIAAQMDALRAW